MKKKLLALLMIATMLVASACGSKPAEKSDAENEVEKIEYIDESEIPEMFSNPEKFKGKYVKISGQIFNGPETEDGYSAYQAWHDITNVEDDFVFGIADDSFADEDYVIVDGKIAGTFESENIMGGKVTCPMIDAVSVEKQSYIDAVVPTLKEITPENAVSEQHGISLKIDKIEFAEKETRVYLTETNNSPDKFSMYTFSMKIVQNGKQIEQDMSLSSYDGNYPELASDILPEASSSGIIVFPPIDSSANFQLYAEGHSDNYELNFNPFTIDISVQ